MPAWGETQRAFLAESAGCVHTPRVLERWIDPFVLRMLRPPARRSEPLPAETEGRAEDVTIASGRTSFKGWLMRSAVPARGAALLVHGWGQSAARMAPLASTLASAGVAALVVDLPGHGRSADVPTYNAKLMVDDLRAARDWIARHAELRLLPAAIVGFSFGGLGAYVAAAHDPRWAALVAIAAPASAMAAARLYLDGKGLPGRWLDGIIRRTLVRAVGVDPVEFDAERTLAVVRVPVLIVHGEGDEVVPVAHAERLRRAATAGSTTLLRVPALGHGAVLDDSTVLGAIADFVRSSLAGARERA